MFVSVVFKYIQVWHCIPHSQTVIYTVKHRGQDYMLVKSDSVKFPLIMHLLVWHYEVLFNIRKTALFSWLILSWWLILFICKHFSYFQEVSGKNLSLLYCIWNVSGAETAVRDWDWQCDCWGASVRICLHPDCKLLYVLSDSEKGCSNCSQWGKQKNKIPTNNPEVIYVHYC